jgi:hypothetical protein
MRSETFSPKAISGVIVRAIFTTMEGQLRYAVDNEGALDFVEEARLSPSPKNDLAA